jgi:hypothetical protein
MTGWTGAGTTYDPWPGVLARIGSDRISKENRGFSGNREPSCRIGSDRLGHIVDTKPQNRDWASVKSATGAENEICCNTRKNGG